MLLMHVVIIHTTTLAPISCVIFFDNIRNNSHAVIVLHISIMCSLMCCNGLVFSQVFKL